MIFIKLNKEKFVVCLCLKHQFLNKRLLFLRFLQLTNQNYKADWFYAKDVLNNTQEMTDLDS